MMKRAAYFALGLTIFALMAPTGGLPSRPRFVAVGINSAAPSTSEFTFNHATTTSAGGTFQNNGTSVGDIGLASFAVSGGLATDFGINVRGANSIVFGSNSTGRISIDGTNGLRVLSQLTARAPLSIGPTAAIDFTNVVGPTIVSSIGVSSPSVSRTAAGIFVVTHNLGTSSYWVSCTERSAGVPQFYQTTALGSTSFTVNSYSVAGLLADGPGAVQCLIIM